MPLMAVDTSRLLVRTSRTMPRMTPPPPRIPNRRSSLSTAANSPRPSPYSSFSPLAFSASTSPPPNLAASSSHALSPIFSSSISDPKKKRGLLGFIDSISINAIFSSSSSVVSLVRLFLPPQHASDAAAPCVRRHSSQTRRNELSVSSPC
nr:uncharacterized protein DDB_G0280205 [Arachis hypogaea]